MQPNKLKPLEVVEQSIMNKLNEEMKEDFKAKYIEKFGTKLEMTANYIFEAFFYGMDQKYLISSCCQVFPKNAKFYDFDKIGTDEDASMNEFGQKYSQITNQMVFKVFCKEENSYQEKSFRVCDPAYAKKLVFSKDKSKLAVFRKNNTISMLGTLSRAKSSAQLDNYVIDIFDCSNIDFFLREEPLSPSDQNLLFTITHSSFTKLQEKQLDRFKLKFTQTPKFLFVQSGLETISLFELKSEDKTINSIFFSDKLPAQYEAIVGIGINEDQIKNSYIGAKRKDYNVIDIFSLAFLDKLKENSPGKIQQSTSEVLETMKNYNYGTIRLTDFNIKTTKIKFSRDNLNAILCDEIQNLLVKLSQNKKQQIQKTITHMQGKQQVKIIRYGLQDFLIATSSPGDKYLFVRHSSDKNIECKVPIRYIQGVVKIIDIFAMIENKMSMLITRGDEEYLIYEFENFNKRTFTQSIYECSKYIFEWPFICYQKLHNLIIIQNAFDPSKIIFIELHNLDKHSQISHIFLTDTLNLIIVVSTLNEYRVYEKNLIKCRNLLLKSSNDKRFEEKSNTRENKFLARSFTLNITQAVQQAESKPIAVIQKNDPKGFNGKPVLKVFAYSSSPKDQLQANPEKIIFFLCNKQIFCIKSDTQFSLEKVDDAKNFKQVRPDLLIYSTVNLRGKKTNELKFIKIEFANYQLQGGYIENEGKLVDFIPSENQLFILCKLKEPTQNVMKIFSIDNVNRFNFQSQLTITDDFFFNYCKTLEQLQNNMIPFGNNVYTIVKYEKETRVYFYNNVLPTNPGEQVTLNSPILNSSYRKMVYFISTMGELKPKQAIILPYLNDNYTMFNKRENMSQLCQFDHFTNDFGQSQTDILTIMPKKATVYHYSLNGGLQQLRKINKEYEKYGNMNLAISPNGKLFVQQQEDDQEFSQIDIVKIELKNQSKDGEDSFYTMVDTDRDTFSKTNSVVKHVTNESGPQERVIAVEHLENIKFEEITFEDDLYEKHQINDLENIIRQFKIKKCDIEVKINNNQDILIAFFGIIRYRNKTERQLKEMIFLKKDQNIRQFWKIRIPESENYNSESAEDKGFREEVTPRNPLKQSLLPKFFSSGNQQQQEAFKDLYSSLTNLHTIQGFNMTDDRLVLWSNTQIFVGEFKLKKKQDDVQNEMLLRKLDFEVHAQGDSKNDKIEYIYSNGTANVTKKIFKKKKIEIQNQLVNYIYIKLSIDNTYCAMIKYNIDKDKEFGSYDCSSNAEIFFDSHNNGFILDYDTIIDINQNVPLFYYKTGMDKVKIQQIFGNKMDKGSRFCNQNELFMINNKVFTPHSYLSFVLIENNIGQTLDSSKYDPEAFFCIGGETSLHSFSNDPKNLEFLLNEYEKTNPKLLNMVLIRSKRDGLNVLEKALSDNNARCVNIILEKLSRVSTNNIHQLKEKFPELLQFTAFEDYLKQCFFQTNQMKKKSLFKRKQNDDIPILYSGSHTTSYFDKCFMNDFEDQEKDAKPKPVTIRALDAGWILKDKFGQNFLLDLSNSDNMKHFEIDTVRLIVNYQWKTIKHLIIQRLFFFFLLGMIAYNIYCIYLYEENSKPNASTGIQLWHGLFQVLILLCTVQGAFVEYKQITFHKEAYLQSFWNMLDLSVVFMAPATVIMDVLGVSGEIIRPIMALCTLIYYVRFFYFLRVFDSTAPLIRIITEITYDIRTFLFIFMVGTVGFGASFYILSNNVDNEDPDQQKFISSFMMSFIYSYRVSLGDFQVDAFSSTLNEFILWTFFILASLFSAIILLNMLVAIMGDSFARVNAESDNQMFREHLQMIVENEFLFDRKSLFRNVKYLIEIQDDIGEGKADIAQNLAIIANSLMITDSKHDEQKHKQEEEMNELRQLIKQQNAQILSMKEMLLKQAKKEAKKLAQEEVKQQ